MVGSPGVRTDSLGEWISGMTVKNYQSILIFDVKIKRVYLVFDVKAILLYFVFLVFFGGVVCYCIGTTVVDVE